MADTEAKSVGEVLTTVVRDMVGDGPVDVNQHAFHENQAVSMTDEKVPETETAPISIKEMLAELDGVFPMDEAVVESGQPRIIVLCEDKANSIHPFQCYKGVHLCFCREIRY